MVTKTKTENLQLLEAYVVRRDANAKAQIVSAYLPLVRRICRKFFNSSDSFEDLLQIGVIGLLNALEKFDVTRGTSFSALAIPEIRGALLNFFRDHGTLMKIPRSIRRSKLIVDKMAAALAPELGHWPTDSELAKACEMSEEEVYQANGLGRGWNPGSLDEVVDSDDAESNAPISEFIGCDDERYDMALDRLMLVTALDTLPDRDKKILKMRFFEQMSQRDVAGQIKISQMHVSRLERGALKQLRQVLVLSQLDKESGRTARCVAESKACDVEAIQA